MIASSPLSLILLTYALGGWVNATIDLARPLSTVNRLGFGLHQTAAASVDRHVFGLVPTVWLQRRLVDGSTHWYDAIAAVVYATHFVAIPLLTALVWFCWRERYRAWIVSVLAFIVVGVAGYILFPASPPWMAARAGLVEPVDRISGIGWPYLHLGSIGQLIGAGQAASNPVAAMPSLHAGGAMLVVLFLWPTVRPRWRPALMAYPLVMGLTLVYTGEHYTVDVVAGWLTAVTAAVAGAIAENGPGIGSGVGRREDPLEALRLRCNRSKSLAPPPRTRPTRTRTRDLYSGVGHDQAWHVRRRRALRGSHGTEPVPGDLGVRFGPQSHWD